MSNLFGPGTCVVFCALPAGIRCPIVVACAHFFTQFSACRGLFCPYARFSLRICDKRRQFASGSFVLCEDYFVGEGAMVRSILVFRNTAGNGVVVPIPPVQERALTRPICTFDCGRRVGVMSFPRRFPYFCAPFVNFFCRGVKNGADVSRVTKESLMDLVLFPSRKRVRLSNFNCCKAIFPVFAVSTVCVAVPTAYA